jgi:hypothetical protein
LLLKFKRTLGVLIFIGVLLALGRLLWQGTWQPRLASGDILLLVRTTLGWAMVLIGMAAFIYGGLLFLVRTLSLIQEPEFLERSELARPRYTPAARQARRENLQALWHSWLPGSRWLALGFFLLILGAVLAR